jgi:hypothetical protein
MAARLLFRERFVYADGAIREMVLWKVPEATDDRPHRLKYRLFHGDSEGRCVVRYYVEAGKGDHRHHGEVEEPYSFVSVEELVADFLADVATARGGTS